MRNSSNEWKDGFGTWAEEPSDDIEPSSPTQRQGSPAKSQHKTAASVEWNDGLGNWTSTAY